jgi:hypothetical protein
MTSPEPEIAWLVAGARVEDDTAGRDVASGGEEWYLGFWVQGVRFGCGGSSAFVLRVRGAGVHQT